MSLHQSASAVLMEPHRLWHDPVVEIYGNLITPGVRCSAEAYDLGNRRWYQLNVDSVVESDEWLSSTVSKHIRDHFSHHLTPPTWNTINTTASGGPTTFETKSEDRVVRPIHEKFEYGSRQDDIVPQISVEELREKTYLSRAADHCSWRGGKCVFKRIEFTPDVRLFETEIRARDMLLKTIGQMESFDEANQLLVQRFRVMPILAVVTDGAGPPGSPGNVVGFIMPFWGNSLDMISENSSDGTVAVTKQQLSELVLGVYNLSRSGIEHKDIRYWNVVVDSRNGGLLLIDMGTEGPDYHGDAKAMGELLLWCLEHSSLKDDLIMKSKVEAAIERLAAEDFEEAIKALS